MPAYKIMLAPCDAGQTVSVDTVIKSDPRAGSGPYQAVLSASSAQIQGLLGYMALIKAGVDTSAVESAITPLNA